MYLLEEEIDYSYGIDKNSDDYMMNFKKPSLPMSREISDEEAFFLERYAYDAECNENENFCKVSKLINNQKYLNDWEKVFIFSLRKRFKKSLICTPMETEKLNNIYSRIF